MSLRFDQLPPWLTDIRPSQLQAVEEIIDAYARGKRLVVLEAPTGAGKSAIAEMVRMNMRGDRHGVYVATTKNLQDQILRDFDAAVLKGKRNYLPIGVGLDDGVTCADCTKKRVDDGCVWCLVPEACPYAQAKSTAMRHRLAVLNTAYLLAQIQTIEKYRITTARDLVVCDEADELEDMLVGRAEVIVTERWQKRWGVPALVKGARAQTIANWCTETGEAARAWIKAHPTPRDVETERMVRTTSELARKLVAIGAGYVLDQGTAIEAEDGIGESWVRDYDDREAGKVMLKPVMVGGWGRELLWDRLDRETRVLAMSATILDPDGWCRDVGVVGVDGAEDWPWEVVRVPSSFPVENRPIWFVPAVSMRRGSDAGERGARWEQMGEAVRSVIGLDKYVGTNTLVHTVSYALSDTIVRAIVANPARRRTNYRMNGAQVLAGTTHDQRPVWTYTSARDRDAAINGYAKDGGVLVASSLERGVDFADELCGLTIITKLPFPNLGDRRVAARSRMRDGNRWYAMQTARALVQMTGRGVRHEDDRADTVVLDRDASDWYRKWKNMLPRYWTEAVRFMPMHAFLRSN